MDGRLNDAQLAWLRNVVGDFRLVRDESWPLTTSSVWHIEDATGRGLAVKSAAPPMESHILREIGAHEAVTRPLSETGEAQTLVAASRELGMLVVSYLPGSLAGTSDARLDATVHTQAARLLARLHSCGPRLDEIYESRRLAATQK